MKTLKTLAVGIALAGWAWWGVSGYAVGQLAQRGESCDRNQGNPCDTSVNHSVDPPNGAALYCDHLGFYGGYECVYPADSGSAWRTGAIPNGNWSAPSPPSNATCASGYFLPNGMNSWNYTGAGDAGGICCAGPADALTEATNFQCVTFTAAAMTGPGFPLTDYEISTNPYAIGCYWSIVHSGQNYYLFDGGAVCANSASPSIDPWWGWVDAGSSVLGGTYHLMRTDPLLHDAGIGINLPLGFFPPITASNGAPNYVCQPQFYWRDGSWLLSDVGAGHADLTECGGDPRDVSTGQYFPCCGEFHDAGLGHPALCQEDPHAVSHCACVPDGNPCDKPRYLDATHWDGVETPLGNGECCSPGLYQQVYTPFVLGVDGGTAPVIAHGQGWCRAAAGVNPYAGSTGSVTVPGYCNCLPEGVSCASDNDCCDNSLSSPGHGFCNAAHGHTCGCSGSGGNCASDHDCCGSESCFDGGPGGNFCT